MGVRAQFLTPLRRPGNRMVLNWDLTPLALLMPACWSGALAANAPQFS